MGQGVMPLTQFVGLSRGRPLTPMDLLMWVCLCNALGALQILRGRGQSMKFGQVEQDL